MEDSRRERARLLRIAGLLLVDLAMSGCDTAAIRVPGLSLSFPESTPEAKGAGKAQGGIFIEVPRDDRAQHIGEDIAKSGWTACKTDTLSAGELPVLVR